MFDFPLGVFWSSISWTGQWLSFPVTVGLVTETQYVGQCLTSTYSQFWELMKSVGMLL
jgi:hypothetical protein